jgi:hypothetical protein
MFFTADIPRSIVSPNECVLEFGIEHQHSTRHGKNQSAQFTVARNKYQESTADLVSITKHREQAQTAALDS